MRAAHPTDNDLIRKARARDISAFDELVTRYQKRAYSLAYGFVGNREDALNLSQECFVRIWRNLGRFKEDEEFYPWFYQILKNLCMTHMTKKTRRAEFSLDRAYKESGFDIEDHSKDPEEAFEIKQRNRRLWKTIYNLKTELREIIIMKHFEGLSYNEMARALNIPVGTVMSRLYNARKKLAAELGDLLV